MRTFEFLSDKPPQPREAQCPKPISNSNSCLFSLFSLFSLFFLNFISAT